MRIITTLFISLFAVATIAQSEVKIKKEDVLIDGQLVMKNRSQFGAGTTFSDMSGKDILFLQHVTETDQLPAYAKIIFIQEKEMLTNQTLFLSRKSFITLLLNNRVLVNGRIDAEQIPLFKMKFHEQVFPKQQVTINVTD